MQKLTFSDDKQKLHSGARFMFFDYETFVNDEKELVPNLAVVQYDDGEEFTFPSSGIVGEDVTEELCEFFFQEKHQDFFVIAHNFQSFDGLFIMRWLLNNAVVPDVIMNGSKIISLKVGEYGIVFRDSLAFVPTNLAGFPALVGIPDLRKGDFPHRFNRSENWNRAVPYPEKEEFDYSRKKEKDQREFDIWYEQDRRIKNSLYDFNAEFIGYCSQVNRSFCPDSHLKLIVFECYQDVTVLRQCCMKFRELYMQISKGLCPFSSGPTLASMCNVLWRTHFLPEKMIGVIKKETASNRHQSAKGLKWLEWKAHELEIDIQTVINGGEKKIGRFYVDGFSQQTNEVFEFYGCFWHGCTKCKF